jgi:haloacetate dehalogenase
MDTADFEAGRKVQCPSSILWTEKSHTHPARVRRPRGEAPLLRPPRKVRGAPRAHYPMEEAPDLLYQELDEFFKG